jgi:hypothetical protein
MKAYATTALQGAECCDGGHELHTIVGGEANASGNGLAGGARLENRSEAAGARIPIRATAVSMYGDFWNGRGHDIGSGPEHAG